MKDIAQNSNIETLQIATVEVADTDAPAFIAASLNFSTCVLTLEFDEYVQTNLNLNRVSLSNTFTAEYTLSDEDRRQRDAGAALPPHHQLIWQQLIL